MNKFYEWTRARVVQFPNVAAGALMIETGLLILAALWIRFV